MKVVSNHAPHDDASTDVKQVSKRAYQLAFIAVLTGFSVGCFYYWIGLTLSTYMDFTFCVGLSFVILLHYVGLLHKLQFYIVLIVCALLITASFIEGSSAGHYMYYFPLMVVIPCIVDFKKANNKDVVIYYGMALLAFIATIVVDVTFKPLETVPLVVSGKMFYTNMCAAFVLTTGFSFTYIYFERKYIKQLLEEERKALEARTRFLSTMGHELRTPLNGIIGAVNLLKEEARLSEDDEYFQIIKYCSDHMLEQVNDILDFNKIEAGKLEIRPVKINLKELLINATLPFYNSFEQKDLQLKVEIDPRLDTTVLADDVRIVQILNNLLSNAMKFTNHGYTRLKVVVDENTYSNLKVNFKVEDTGIGIDEADQKNVFDSFWQVYDQNTRYVNGTGLGLSICVRLLALMDSKLELSSVKDQGSTFSFSIVFTKYKDAHRKTRSHSLTDVNNLQGIRVLLVEDNLINMMIAKKILTSLQAGYTAAANGLEALECLKSDPHYDVVLLDLEMPVLNGYETIVKMKELFPQIPVLAFTASLVDQKMFNELTALGFSDVIIKPFQPYQLLSQIKESIIKSRQPERVEVE